MHNSIQLSKPKQLNRVYIKHNRSSHPCLIYRLLGYSARKQGGRILQLQTIIVGGVAQRLGRRPLDSRLSLPCTRSIADR